MCWGTWSGNFGKVYGGLNSNTWQHLSAVPVWGGGYVLAFVDTSGTTWSLSNLNALSNFTSSGWRAASPMVSFGDQVWHGITCDGRLELITSANSIPSPVDLATLFEQWPDLQDQRFLTVAATTLSDWLPAGACLITSSAHGICLTGVDKQLPRPPFALTRLPDLVKVHATCISTSGWACFLSVYGDVRCWSFYQWNDLKDRGIRTPIVPPPAAGDPWVEIVCGEAFVCARSASGAVRCFPDPYFSFDPSRPLELPQLSGQWAALAAFPTDSIAQSPVAVHLCGISTANELRCFVSRTNPTEQVRPNTTFGEPGSTWAAVAVSQNLVCGISSN